MHLRLLRHKTGQHDLEEEHEATGTCLDSSVSGHERRVVVPTGAAIARLREAEPEWPWWLSSPATDVAEGGSNGEADVGRRWSLQQDETDEPTSLPAA
jgi:hypothetical protein